MPSEHTSLKWLRTDVDVTYWRRIDASTTSVWRHVPAGSEESHQKRRTGTINNKPLECGCERLNLASLEPILCPQLQELFETCSYLQLLCLHEGVLTKQWIVTVNKTAEIKTMIYQKWINVMRTLASKDDTEIREQRKRTSYFRNLRWRRRNWTLTSGVLVHYECYAHHVPKVTGNIISQDMSLQSPNQGILPWCQTSYNACTTQM